MKTKYTAQNSDLPSIFLESGQRGINPVAVAKARIHSEAKSMSIELSADELAKFSLILLGLEQN